MHLQISYIFAVFTHRNRIFFLHSIATTTSVLLYLSLGGSVRFVQVLVLLISSYKGYLYYRKEPVVV